MPDDDKWLWNQPKTWHDIDRALHDISALLEYLGTAPDGRLLGYFADTQGRIGDGAAKRTVPPCASYTEFLSLIFQVSEAFQTGRQELLPTLPAPAEGQPKLSPEAFVYWSRDFLSAVAAPATAESIRLTHDYVIRRARRWRWRGSHGRTTPPPATGLPPLPQDPDASERKMLAKRLARWVQFSERITVLVVILTVAVSIYALSGRLILANAEDMEAAWKTIDQQLEAQEDRLLSLPTQPAGFHDIIVKSGLCAYRKPREEVTATNTALPGPAHALALPGENLSDTPPALLPVAEAETDFVSAHQAHLCDESAKVLLNLFTVTMHLQSWNSLVTERIGEGWTIGIRGHDYTLPVALPLAPLFGVSPSNITEYAADGRLCSQIAPEIYDPGSKGLGCQKLLLTMINRAHRVAESILGSITQYILPVFYGFLGAMAAALRMLRRKVDASLLNYTDRARLQQSAVLGILCGAVIGLFASYIGKTDTASSLGLSAIALLAGYNADGVFRLLDELSDRIFRTTAAPKT